MIDGGCLIITQRKVGRSLRPTMRGRGQGATRSERLLSALPTPGPRGGGKRRAIAANGRKVPRFCRSCEARRKSGSRVHLIFAYIRQSRGTSDTFGKREYRRSRPSRLIPTFSITRAEAGLPTSQNASARKIAGCAKACSTSHVMTSVAQPRPQARCART